MHLLKYLFIGIENSHSQREGEKDLHSTGSLLMWLQRPELGQCETRASVHTVEPGSQELKQASKRGLQKPLLHLTELT